MCMWENFFSLYDMGTLVITHIPTGLFHLFHEVVSYWNTLTLPLCIIRISFWNSFNLNEGGMIPMQSLAW